MQYYSIKIQLLNNYKGDARKYPDPNVMGMRFKIFRPNSLRSEGETEPYLQASNNIADSLTSFHLVLKECHGQQGTYHVFSLLSGTLVYEQNVLEFPEVINSTNNERLLYHQIKKILSVAISVTMEKNKLV